MSVDDMYGMMIAFAVMVAFAWTAGLALGLSVVRRWFQIPFRAAIGSVLILAAAAIVVVDVVGYWRARELPVVPGWIVGLGLLGGILVAQWRYNRDPDEPRRAPLDRRQKCRLAGKGLVALGFLGVPFALWSPVSGTALLSTWLAGSVLWIVGATAMARERARRRRRDEVTYDPRRSEELGRWIDGRWVCVEHGETWCTTCADRAARPQPVPTPRSGGGGAVG